MSADLFAALTAEHPNHPLGPDPDCPSCARPAAPDTYDAPAAFITHRFTGNSRGPGQDGVSVAISITAYEECLKCGGKKPAGPHPHAPHYSYVVRGLADCVGSPIEVQLQENA